MAASVPVPASFKPIQHHIKTAVEHDGRDPVVAYYCKSFQPVSSHHITWRKRKQASRASVSEKYL